VNKNAYETLLFLLVALTLLCIVGLAVAVKGDPTKFMRNATLQGATIYFVQRDGSLVQPYLSPLSSNVNAVLETAGLGKWLSPSSANPICSSYTDHLLLIYLVNQSSITLQNKGVSGAFVTFNFGKYLQGLYVLYIRFTSSAIEVYLYDSNKQLVYSGSTGKSISCITAIDWDGYGAVYYINSSTSSLVGQIANAFTLMKGIGILINFNTGPIDLTYSFMNATPTTVSAGANTKRAYMLLNYSGNPIAYIKLAGPAGALEKTLRTPGEYYIRASDYNITVFPYVQATRGSQASNTTSSTAGLQSVTFTVYAKDGNTGLDVSGTVYLNGTLLGNTGKALTATLNPNATQTIKVSASGYYDYTFSARVYRGAQYYVFLTPISPVSEKVSVTFYTYDAITGNSIQGSVSSGFTTYQTGKTYNISKGYYTFTASASGYKSLTFSVYISSNTVIPIYLYPQSYTATNSSGSVGYNPSTPTTTISQPNPNTYTGEYVGFHFINPSNTSVTVNVYAQVKTSIMGSVYNVLVDTVSLPARSDSYKAYNLRDVAGKAGVLVVGSVNPAEFLFTITANGNRIAQLTGDSAYQRYVDIYVASGNGYVSAWGSGLTGSTLGSFQWGDMLTQLMPLLIIAMIFGLIASFMPSKRR